MSKFDEVDSDFSLNPRLKASALYWSSNCVYTKAETRNRYWTKEVNQYLFV